MGQFGLHINIDPFYSDLVKDLPNAMKGIDDALMSFVPQFRTALLAGRGISQSASASQKQESSGIR
ncbi:hypothetical protein WJ60_10825 [Burkholderia ubonensis]|nr:hypothetical protein WJ60_10825 [Burkholderia ubonensis]KVZ03625.1 hypothetical protein WL11_15615 [Burkholderia ubonensis]